MKLKFFISGLGFLIMLSTCILVGCSDGEKGSSAAVDMSGWPDDLPKFEDGKLFQVLNNEDTGVLNAAVFGKIKDPETAYENYKTALIKKGWVLDYDSTNEHVWSGGYKKASNSVDVNIQKDGSAAQIMYLAR